MWEMGGEMARPKDCPMDAWAELIKYWKTSLNKHECE